MTDEWDDSYEPGGITLGPEERLEREIARSKALKVERLKMRDRIAGLEQQVEALTRENERLQATGFQPAPVPGTDSNSNPAVARPTGRGGFPWWLWGGLAATALALFFWAFYWLQG